jgi:hypothetical protein
MYYGQTGSNSVEVSASTTDRFKSAEGFARISLKGRTEFSWSALADDFRTFLLMPGASESIFQQFKA